MPVFHLSRVDGHPYIKGFIRQIRFTKQVTTRGWKKLIQAGLGDGDEIPRDLFQNLRGSGDLFTAGRPATAEDQPPKEPHAASTFQAHRKPPEPEASDVERWLAAVFANVLAARPAHTTMWLCLAKYVTAPAEKAYCYRKVIEAEPDSVAAKSFFSGAGAQTPRRPQVFAGCPWFTGDFPFPSPNYAPVAGEAASEDDESH